jgi:hypothetical protein
MQHVEVRAFTYLIADFSTQDQLYCVYLDDNYFTDS